MRNLLSTVALTILVLSLSTGAFAQDEDMEMEMETGTGGDISVGVLVGLSIPGGDPGTGGSFDPGFGFKAFGQYDLSAKVKDLAVELAVGLTMFNSKFEGNDASVSVTSVNVNVLYSLSNVKVMESVGLFVFGGPGFYSLSWDETRDVTSQSVMGVNFGLGVNYKINPQVNANLRIGAGVALTEAREINGNLQGEDYGHSELPSVKVGVTYSL